MTRPRRIRSRAIRERKGATLVETAVVLPVFLLMVCMVFELGHAYFVYNSMQVGCRKAARMGTLLESDNGDVIGMVEETLQPVGSLDHFDITVRDGSSFDGGGSPPTTGAEIAQLSPVNVSSVGTGNSFVVHAHVPYRDIALLPLPSLLPALSGMQLHAYTVSRRE